MGSWYSAHREGRTQIGVTTPSLASWVPSWLAWRAPGPAQAGAWHATTACVFRGPASLVSGDSPALLAPRQPGPGQLVLVTRRLSPQARCPPGPALTPRCPPGPAETEAVPPPAELRKQVESAELRNQRLKEVFQAKVQEFRKVCYTLTGYQVDITRESQYRLTSMYAERQDDCLVFKVGLVRGLHAELGVPVVRGAPRRAGGHFWLRGASMPSGPVSGGSRKRGHLWLVGGCTLVTGGLSAPAQLRQHTAPVLAVISGGHWAPCWATPSSVTAVPSLTGWVSNAGSAHGAEVTGRAGRGPCRLACSWIPGRCLSRAARADRPTGGRRRLGHVCRPRLSAGGTGPGLVAASTRSCTCWSLRGGQPVGPAARGGRGNQSAYRFLSGVSWRVQQVVCDVWARAPVCVPGIPGALPGGHAAPAPATAGAARPQRPDVLPQRERAGLRGPPLQVGQGGPFPPVLRPCVGSAVRGVWAVGEACLLSEPTPPERRVLSS
ncbi:hypothetical protein QTO34_016409 [Cnephaeus nilssonii]|uniref:Uncharacterized protein n=1 Tax=Cnephaeus nilssonii TaxID=3371016 RepID=A0AA40I643_CNENI|nr:hypothetical protein QTO34_016409 [Eptesicus nilssonii]